MKRDSATHLGLLVYTLSYLFNVFASYCSWLPEKRFEVFLQMGILPFASCSADTRLLTPTCRYSTWRSLINGTTERAGLQSETFVFIEEAAKPRARNRELAAAASHAQKRERVLASASAH